MSLPKKLLTASVAQMVERKTVIRWYHCHYAKILMSTVQSRAEAKFYTHNN